MALTYKELLEKKENLLAQVRNLDKAIRHCEYKEQIDCLATAVTALETFTELNTAEQIYIEHYCEECEQDIDIHLDFDVVIEALKDVKKEVERESEKMVNNI